MVTPRTPTVAHAERRARGMTQTIGERLRKAAASYRARPNFPPRGGFRDSEQRLTWRLPSESSEADCAGLHRYHRPVQATRRRDPTSSARLRSQPLGALRHHDRDGCIRIRATSFDWANLGAGPTLSPEIQGRAAEHGWAARPTGHGNRTDARGGRRPGVVREVGEHTCWTASASCMLLLEAVDGLNRRKPRAVQHRAVQ
jgi:hypothetical protein